nr:uncharacterized protein LOC123775091 [Procambarus clarkii]
MSATMQMVRDTAVTSTWSSIFPPQQRTREESLLFVKKLIAVGISSITYLRTLFPEGSYSNRNLDGLQLKMLLENSSCNSSNMVVSWIKGCFEAIEKKYLRQLTLVIYNDPDKPELALETYTFKLRYTEEEGAVISELEASSNPSKKEKRVDVKKSTEKMLRTILLLTQTLKPLPRKIHLAMKLGYYDNVTPEDYEPPGFKEGGHGGCMFESEPINIKVGDVTTRFHTIKLRVSVDRKSYSTDENSAEEKEDSSFLNKSITKDNMQSSQSTEVLIRSYAKLSLPRTLSSGSPSTGRSSCINYNDNHDAAVNGHLMKEHDCTRSGNQLEDNTMSTDIWVPSVTPENTSTNTICRLVKSSQDDAQLVPQMSTQTSTSNLQPCMKVTQNSNVRTPSLPSPIQTTPASAVSTRSMRASNNQFEAGFMVRCPCNVNHDDGLMILCDMCNNWQHAVCFCVLDESEAPQRHICEACATPDTPSTDPTLTNHPELEMCCLYRRTLVFLRDKSHRITAAVLGQRLGVNISIAKKIFNRVQKDKLVKSKGKAGVFPNHTNILQFAFPMYLNRKIHEGKTDTDNGVSDAPRTPNSMCSTADFDNDVTPDLPIYSLRDSIAASRADECTKVMAMSLDETLDIVSDTQDVTVGTQAMQMVIDNGLEVIDSEKSEPNQETISEIMATAGDTMATYGSQLATEENITTCALTPTKSLQNSKDEDKVCASDKKSQGRKSMKRKRTLVVGEVRLSCGKKTVSSESMNIHHFEISDSQGSDGLYEKRVKTSTATDI